MPVVRPDNGTVFHFFRVIYLGYPSTMLEELWSVLLATDGRGDQSQWKECMDAIAESFRNTGVMVSSLSSECLFNHLLYSWTRLVSFQLLPLQSWP
jgi:hypothetical protein